MDSSLAVDFSEELDAGKRKNPNSECEGCRYKKNMRLCQAQIFFFENNRYEIVCLNISKRLIAQDTKFWLPKTRTEMGP